MKEKSILRLITYILTLVFTLALSACLALSFLMSFDAKLPYFTNETVFPALSAILALTFVIIIFVLALICKNKSSQNGKTNAFEKAALLFSSLLSLASAIILLTGKSYDLFLVLSILSILSFTAFTVLIAFFGEEYHGASFVLLCLSSIYPIITAYTHYTNILVPINSALNTINFCFCIAFLIFVLCESQQLLKRKARFAFASKLICFMVSLSASLSYLAGVYFKKISDKSFLPTMIFALAVSICSITLAALQLKKEKSADEN